MTTIILAPARNGQPEIQVFGRYEGDDDRFVFGIRSFPADQTEQAEDHARWMMDKFAADHFKRVTR